MTDLTPDFKNCKNCGKHLPIKNTENINICSKKCSVFYTKCKTCNTYFLKNEIENNYCSIKCKMIFNLNKNGYPKIKTTPYKIMITGDPAIYNELIARKLSLILKLPLLMTAQIKKENQLTVENVIKRIENNGDFFILLSNSYEIEFIKKFNTVFNMDLIIDIKDNNDVSDFQEIIRCDNCSSINSFSDPDSENKRHCLICESSVYKNIDNINSINTKRRNYREISDYLGTMFSDKYIGFTREDVKKTVDKITAYFVYGTHPVNYRKQ